jgi:ubiquinone/menaquinone biosynthesis C-methylase UbiE
VRGSRVAGLAATVIGVDNSPAMLGADRENPAVLDADNVTVVEADLDALPLPDNSVDVAVANMVLHPAAPLQWCLRKMARVVWSGGKVWSPTRWSTTASGCAPNRRTSGWGSPPAGLGPLRQRSADDYGYASLGMQ